MDSINSSTPPLCAKGCGFFGSPENENFCSKCYKDYPKEGLIAEPSKKLSEPIVVTPSFDDNSPDVVTDETTSTTTAVASTSKVKNGCECCNKKVGLMGFECHCGSTFCGFVDILWSTLVLLISRLLIYKIWPSKIHLLQVINMVPEFE